MLLERKPKDDNYDNYNHNGAYANNEYQSNNNHERYENGDQQVNEKNNSFILSEEDKKNEQQDIKEHYSNDSHSDTQTLMRIETIMPTIKTTTIKTTIIKT